VDRPSEPSGIGQLQNFRYDSDSKPLERAGRELRAPGIAKTEAVRFRFAGFASNGVPYKRTR